MLGRIAVLAVVLATGVAVAPARAQQKIEKFPGEQLLVLLNVFGAAPDDAHVLEPVAEKILRPAGARNSGSLPCPNSLGLKKLSASLADARFNSIDIEFCRTERPIQPWQAALLVATVNGGLCNVKGLGTLDCLLPRSCLEVQPHELRIAARPMAGCSKVRNLLSWIVPDRFRMPFPEPEQQREMAQTLRMVPEEKKLEALGSILGDWRMPFSFYSENTRSALDVLAKTEPEMHLQHIARELDLLVAKLGCGETWKQLAAVAPDVRTRAFLEGCPPARDLLTEHAGIEKKPMERVLLAIAMAVDARGLKLENNDLHKAALETLLGK